MKLLVPAVLLFVSTDAFQVQPSSGSRGSRTGGMSMTSTETSGGDTVSRRYFAQFGAAAFASVLLGNSKEASALSDSSMMIADDIKTLDFSLPSYDSISSSKASIGNVDGLTEQVTPKDDEPKGMPRRKVREPKEPGENPMASILPSMKKKGPSQASKPKAEKVRPAPKEKEEKGPVFETMDLSLPSYSDSASTGKSSIFSI